MWKRRLFFGKITTAGVACHELPLPGPIVCLPRNERNNAFSHLYPSHV